MREQIADFLHSAAGFFSCTVGAAVIQIAFYFPSDCEGGLADTQVQADSCKTPLGIAVSPDLTSEAAGGMALGLSLVLAGILYFIGGLLNPDHPDAI